MRISDWSSDVCSSDLGDVRENIGAHIGGALAAILHQEGDKAAHAVVIGAIVDRAALTFGLNEADAFEGREMMRHGRRRNIGPLCDDSDRKSVVEGKRGCER